MEYIKKIIEALKDPKKKSLVLIVIYFIFFVFVFIVLNNSNTTQSPNIEEIKDPIQNYKEMKSYEYVITINKTGISDSIDGIYYNNKSLFNYNLNKYYFEDKIYLINNDYYYLSNIEYNISKLFNNNISSLFDSFQKLSETEFVDGTKKSNYTLDSNIFYKYYFDVDSNYNSLINIELTQENNYITNIYIDLTNLQLDIKSINIKYLNINNISNLDFNKDNYIYQENETIIESR